MKSILVVSKDGEVVRTVHSCFPSDYRVESVSSRNDCLAMLKKGRYDLVFIDIEALSEPAPGNGYPEVLESFWHLCPTLKIIVMSSQEKTREVVKAVKAGANDYLTYPLDPGEVNLVVQGVHKAEIIQSELDFLRDQFWEADSLDIIHTRNSRMRTVYEKLRSVAPTKSTVLLVGETGVGKGVLAQLIHRHSNRKDAQFISVHCGAIPDTLLESELFGHEKGAFTGAIRRKLGKFEIASGGTIFLDEVGTVTPSAQIKLLQVLQDATFQRVGGEVTFEANVRIIAATNADLKAMCEDGRFRRDLYYRLDVFPIEMPPLRDRLEDIPHLAGVFLKKLNRINEKEIRSIDSRVLESFRHYSWPGNIRELENLLERAYVLETSGTLAPESFPGELFDDNVLSASVPIDPSHTLAEVRRRGIEDIERNYLKDLLSRHQGKIKDSAEAAGITTRQLHKLMAKYGIRKEDFKRATAPKPSRDVIS